MSEKYLIIYADDDLDDLELVRDAFAKYSTDIEILHGADGAEALQILQGLIEKNTYPCLIMLDINMPGMDGRQALLHIKENEQTKKIATVLFTTSNSQKDKDFAREWGADFITKPLNFAEVEALAEELVKRCKIAISRN